MSIDISKQLKREPQRYGNLELYPILLLDIDIYEIFLETLCIPKDYISEKEVIKMSYLKYLLFFFQGLYDMQSGTGDYTHEYQNKLIKLLEYITRQPVEIQQIIDDIIDDNIMFHYEVYIGEEVLYEYDFDKMREVILEQNGQNLEYIESYHPDLEKSLEVVNKSLNRIPFIHRVLAYSSISNIDLLELAKWTVFEFEEKETLLRTYENWKIYKPLEASGQIELKGKDKIQNPFEYEKKSTNRYDSIMIKLDDFMNDLEQFT